MRVSKPGMLLGLTVGMVAFNGRTAAVSVGPILPSLQADLAVSATMAGLLTALPTLCFAVFGFLGPGFAARIGLHRAIFAALALNVAGQIGRILSVEVLGFIAASIATMAGIGVINVLLPPLVKQHFPIRNGLMTAIYTTTQATGLMLASLYTAPLAQALGGWRGAFWAWVATAIAALPLLAWSISRFQTSLVRRRPAVTLAQVARTRLGWMLAVFFGTQSAQAYTQFGWLPTIYQSAGFSPVAAGGYLGVVAGVGIPIAFIVPGLTSRMRRPQLLLVVIVVNGLIGYLGLLWDPAAAPVLWAVLLAVSSSAFPMVLVLLTMRTTTPIGTAALSSFAQAAGYVLASIGPFLLGALRDSTSSWVWPLGLQIALFVPMSVCGWLAIRSGPLEDELGPPAG